jgi:hypothetical protein
VAEVFCSVSDLHDYPALFCHGPQRNREAVPTKHLLASHIVIIKLWTKEICSFIIAYLVKWHFGKVKRRFVGPKSDNTTRHWKLCWAGSIHLSASNLGFILCYHPSRYPKRVPIKRVSCHNFVCICSLLSELHGNLRCAFALRILCGLNGGDSHGMKSIYFIEPSIFRRSLHFAFKIYW